ncbi:MAG TPA: Sapep family Mn(2+)-dependent dipeptidase [Thermoanaerobaculia bacterium]
MILSSLLLAATLADAKAVERRFTEVESKRLVPMLQEVVRFPTYAGNDEGFAAQKEWLMKTAADLGFTARDAGKVTEIELPGPPNAPVLGLVIHGDVQPVEADAWSFPPFEGGVADGYVRGRGAADDKGPLVQALLVMKSLEASGLPRTHTIRLLVGTDEESANTDIAEYLKTHDAPDYSLVLDSEFPVVVGEKAWDGLEVSALLAERPGAKQPYVVTKLTAGLAASIVPDSAEVALRWISDAPADWSKVMPPEGKYPLPEGTRLVISPEGETLRIVAYGKSAHAGVNPTGGRNALVALARAVEGKLPPGGADDLLAFVRMAGKDLYGTGLEITDNDPIWGRYFVNIATIKPNADEPGRVNLFINLRRTPPRTAPQALAHLEGVVQRFNAKQGSTLRMEKGFFGDEPLAFNPNANIVKRLLASYEQATGEKAKPAISGGGTYAKRLPRSIAFGMWFPGKPYPGHDVDEKMPIADLERGARVLVHALVDIATGPRMEEPF